MVSSFFSSKIVYAPSFFLTKKYKCLPPVVLPSIKICSNNFCPLPKISFHQLSFTTLVMKKFEPRYLPFEQSKPENLLLHAHFPLMHFPLPLLSFGLVFSVIFSFSSSVASSKHFAFMVSKAEPTDILISSVAYI